MYCNVSIIIPFFNHGKYIKETLESVLKSEYSNFEIIIVNDGSDKSNTFQLNQTIKDINDNRIKIYDQINYGPSAARNFGVQISKGEYIVFLDADDLIEKNTLKICINEFYKDKKVDVVYGNNILFGEKNMLIKPIQISEKNILIYNPIAICVMIKRKTLLKFPFDEYLSKLGLEDWELWINLIANKIKFCYVNEILFRIRVLNNSRTTIEANKNLEKIKSYIFQKHSDFVYNQYYNLYYLQKQTLETPDYRIGNLFLKPYRFVKKIIRKFFSI